jgi:hypothetical protein
MFQCLATNDQTSGEDSAQLRLGCKSTKSNPSYQPEKMQSCHPLLSCVSSSHGLRVFPIFSVPNKSEPQFTLDVLYYLSMQFCAF